MPLISASVRKPAASAIDTRFEIVIVKRSVAAANAIKAGKSRSRAISRIIGLPTGMADAGSQHRQSLGARNEQSENASRQAQFALLDCVIPRQPTVPEQGKSGMKRWLYNAVAVCAVSGRRALDAPGASVHRSLSASR